VSFSRDSYIQENTIGPVKGGPDIGFSNVIPQNVCRKTVNIYVLNKMPRDCTAVPSCRAGSFENEQSVYSSGGSNTRTKHILIF
jgi:hypothetical protein